MTDVTAEQQPFSIQRWKVGDITITKIVESQQLFDIPAAFPEASVEDLLALPWLQPHFVTPEGRGILSIHALVVDTPAKRIIVDTCVGNGKDRAGWAHYANRQTSFLRDLEAAGFAPESFDVVLCTHLHVDHVGWNTVLEDGQWRPTFPNARYLLNRSEYEYWAAPLEQMPGGFDIVQRLTFSDSVQPIFEAGLVDLVEGAYSVCEEVSLVPTPGHSPGHVSVRISSCGEEALITGDIAHHPCQLAHVHWGIPHIDFNFEQAIETRRCVFAEVADRPVLVIGTHWAGATAGQVKRCGEAFKLEC
ncbi:MAG TPA: MBL fold metallo-hydrolase [Acidocella sp.]|jgi:glyoxylase-like metal-dependent hydrolase (beta-lactamase superfamily II)|nr:MBL fold metallo-hydrolase [Acidocella sp.]